MKNNLLAFFCIISVPCFSQSDHLIPVNGIFSSYEYNIEYSVPLRKLLYKNIDRQFIARVIVKPSFRPEYLISIEKHKDGVFLIVNTLSEQFWYSKDTAKTKTYTLKVLVDEQFADSIRETFDHCILNTKYPCDTLNGVDGTTFEFMTYNFGVGVRAGETWSPDKNTNMKKLTDLSNMLREACLKHNFKSQRNPILEFCSSLKGN